MVYSHVFIGIERLVLSETSRTIWDFDVMFYESDYSTSAVTIYFLITGK